MINHYIVRLHVAMHDSLRMAVIQGLEQWGSVKCTMSTEARTHLQQFKHIEAHIEVRKTRIQDFEVDIMDVFRD